MSSAATDSPLTVIWPPGSAGWTPARILMSVDLPEPFPPTSARISPCLTTSETFDRACVPGNDFERFSMRSRTSGWSWPVIGPHRLLPGPDSDVVLRVALRALVAVVVPQSAGRWVRLVDRLEADPGVHLRGAREDA